MSKSIYDTTDFSKVIDCAGYGCSECKACRYYDFIEYAEGCCPPEGVIDYDREFEKELKEREAVRL